ncbi:MAG: hypothetical protein HXN00_00375 [Porphyromonadaceae bacterium]|nr:hypothetical protein [Porphyromonadaceae bacterium]
MVEKKPEKLPPLEEVEGHNLLLPPHALRPSKRMRLVSAVEPVINGKVGEDDMITIMADIMETLEDSGVVKDMAAWSDFFDNAGLEDVVNLVLAYVGEASGAKN